jgi:hypothetical protein
VTSSEQIGKVAIDFSGLGKKKPTAIFGDERITSVRLFFVCTQVVSHLSVKDVFDS